MSYNILKEIPEAVEQLRRLRELHASANQLTRLPEALERLPQPFVLAPKGIASTACRAWPYAAADCASSSGVPQQTRARVDSEHDRHCRYDGASSSAHDGAHAPACQQESRQLVLLELEANGVARMPVLNPQNAYLGSVLASFN